MKKLTEHLWSGIIRRSETGEDRKEDDVNVLDWESFKEYMNDRYVVYGEKPCKSYISGKSLILSINNHSSYGVLLRERIGESYCIIVTHRSDNTNWQGLFFTTEMKKKYGIEDKKLKRLPLAEYRINLQTNKDILHFIDDFIKMPKFDDFNNDTMIKKVKN